MFDKVKSSFYEFKKIKNLSVLSMLLMLKILVSLFQINISFGVKISFGFLIYIIVASFYGFFSGVIFTILAYLLNFVTGVVEVFHIGFLISSIFCILIYSIFLYKLKLLVKRVVIATIINDLVIHFILNNIWLSQIYNTRFSLIFSVRILKNIIMLPIDCVLGTLIVIALQKIVQNVKI